MDPIALPNTAVSSLSPFPSLLGVKVCTTVLVVHTFLSSSFLSLHSLIKITLRERETERERVQSERKRGKRERKERKGSKDANNLNFQA